MVVADDHAVFRRGLALVLGPEEDIEVVAEAADTQQAIAAVIEHLPHVVLMDLRMPGGGGIEATRRIRALHPEVRVIVLTVSDDDDDLFGAVRAGAVGYLLKDVSIEEVADAVRAVAAGGSLLSPSMTAKLLGGFADLSDEGPGRSPRRSGPAGTLTDRELETLRGLTRGLSNREIAGELGIAENTVKNHVRAILEKLDAKSRTEAALYAVREGLVEAAG